MKKPGSRKILPVIALLVAFVSMAEYVSATNLREIRTGKKSGFTRLVFQFETLPLFQVQDKAIPDELSLLFMETTSGLLRTKKTYAAPVKTITIQQDGPHLKAVVALSTPGYRLKTFTLNEPHRVVFDLYPAVAEGSQVLLNKLVVKASAEAGLKEKTPVLPAVEPEPAVTEISQPPAMDSKPAAAEISQPLARDSKPAPLEPKPDARAPEPVPPVEKASGNSPQATPAPAPPPDPSMVKKTPSENNAMIIAVGTFQRNLITVLAGISIVILALIGLLLLQKRNHTEKSRSVESGEELKTTADIMASIDARIKEKFKQYEEATRSE